jgi:hypothetical protein
MSFVSIDGSVHCPLSFRAIPLALISCSVKQCRWLWGKRPTRCRSNAETRLQVRLHPVQEETGIGSPLFLMSMQQGPFPAEGVRKKGLADVG